MFPELFNSIGHHVMFVSRTPTPFDMHELALHRSISPTVSLRCFPRSRPYRCSAKLDSQCQSLPPGGVACVLRGGVKHIGLLQVCFEVYLAENQPTDFGDDHQETDPHIVRIGWSADSTSFQLGIVLSLSHIPSNLLYIRISSCCIHTVASYVFPFHSQLWQNNMSGILLV